MATFLIALFSVILVLVCCFVTLMVLMQKPSANSGMGAALGGGAAEQAFGGEAGNVLTRGTIYAIIAFFVLSFGLYLGTIATVEQPDADAGGASITKLEGETPMEAAPPAESAPLPAGESVPPASDDAEASGAVEEDSTSEQPAPADDGAAASGSTESLQLEDLDQNAPKPVEGS